MIRLIEVGETGVDFAYSKPPPARLIELGYSFAVGYCSTNQSKNLLDPWAYINAGLGVMYVFELSATRPNGGASAGTADGLFAKAWLQGMAYPFDVPFLAAFDTNTTAANIAAHVAYFNAFAVACRPYLLGAYLDTDLAARVDEVIGWLPLAWSWSGSSSADARAKATALGYHVLQGKGFYIDNQWAVDPNVAIRQFPTWGIPKIAPNPPAEEDMIDTYTNTEVRNGYPAGVYQYATDGVVKRNLGAAHAELKAAGKLNAPVGLSNAALDSIPDYVTPVSVIPPVVIPPTTVPAPVVVFPNYSLQGSLGAQGVIVASLTKV